MVGCSHGRGDMNLPTDPSTVVEMGIPSMCRVHSYPQWSCPTGVKVGYGPVPTKMVICTVNLLISAL